MVALLLLLGVYVNAGVHGNVNPADNVHDIEMDGMRDSDDDLQLAIKMTNSTTNTTYDVNIWPPPQPTRLRYANITKYFSSGKWQYGLSGHGNMHPFAIALLLFGVAALSWICHMLGSGAVTGPPWDPAGNVPFRTWTREVQAWLNVTSSRLQPSRQAAAIQLGLRGVAREFALTIPPAAINFGAVIAGTPTDPVTYLLYTLGNRFEALEDERSMA